MDNNTKNEIKENYHQIKCRIRIILSLFWRCYLKRGTRKNSFSILEYENYWENFWRKKDILRKDLLFTDNDLPVKGLSPLEFKKKVIINILSEKISTISPKNVLEIGSGAGLNLLLLAPLFPNINFYGLEPTISGVKMSQKFILSPPKVFKIQSKLKHTNNINIIHGSILDKKTIKKLTGQNFDFVFTCAAMEQLSQYLDIAFRNIFSLSNGYFLFYEEWLEGNYLIQNYKTLVDSDYFRISWNYLHKYKDIKTIERNIPSLQPSWLKYSSVFAKKIL